MLRPLHLFMFPSFRFSRFLACLALTHHVLELHLDEICVPLQIFLSTKFTTLYLLVISCISFSVWVFFGHARIWPNRIWPELVFQSVDHICQTTFGQILCFRVLSKFSGVVVVCCSLACCCFVWPPGLKLTPTQTRILGGPGP